MSFLDVVEQLRFIKHSRERQAAVAAAERVHQLALVDRLAGMIESLSEGQSKQITDVTSALVEIAKSNQAQAEGFTTWLKSFQVTSPPTSTTVRDDDELVEESQRFYGELGLDPADVPEEFRLALQLQKGISDIGLRDAS